MRKTQRERAREKKKTKATATSTAITQTARKIQSITMNWMTIFMYSSGHAAAINNLCVFSTLTFYGAVCEFLAIRARLNTHRASVSGWENKYICEHRETLSGISHLAPPLTFKHNKHKSTLVWSLFSTITDDTLRKAMQTHDNYTTVRC